jgi:hypothetical protein
MDEEATHKATKKPSADEGGEKTETQQDAESCLQEHTKTILSKEEQTYESTADLRTAGSDPGVADRSRMLEPANGKRHFLQGPGTKSP